MFHSLAVGGKAGNFIIPENNTQSFLFGSRFILCDKSPGNFREVAFFLVQIKDIGFYFANINDMVRNVLLILVISRELRRADSSEAFSVSSIAFRFCFSLSNSMWIAFTRC